MNKNYIGENIRIYRERKNITQRELGDKIGKTWEMVSRYERGASSPLNQIDTLADALDVDVKDLFKDPTHNEIEKLDFNRVPLFTSIPKNMEFLKGKSTIYYTAPDWILDIDKDCFLLLTDLVIIQTDRVVNGKLYISPNSNVSVDDIVLKRDKNKLIVEEFGLRENKEIIGKVLAQEVIFTD